VLRVQQVVYGRCAVHETFEHCREVRSCEVAT
jgi:hypothetical protein